MVLSGRKEVKERLCNCLLASLLVTLLCDEDLADDMAEVKHTKTSTQRHIAWQNMKKSSIKEHYPRVLPVIAQNRF